MKYIGIDIGATNLKAGLVDETGLILAKQKMKVAQIESPDSLARHLARMTEELAGEAGVDVTKYFPLGWAFPAWWRSAPARCSIAATCRFAACPCAACFTSI